MKLTFKQILDINNWIDSEEILSRVDFTPRDVLSKEFELPSEVVAQNTAFFNYEPIVEDSFKKYLQKEIQLFWKKFFDLSSKKNIKPLNEVFKNKKLIFTCPFAGLGHLKEIEVFADIFCDITKTQGLIIQPEEYLTGLEAMLFRGKVELHGYMQKDKLNNTAYKKIFGEMYKLYPNTMQKFIISIAEQSTKFSLAATGYDKQNQEFISDIGRRMVKIFGNQPILVKFLINLIANIDITLSGTELVNIWEKIFDIYDKPDFLFTSYPFIIRSYEAKSRNTDFNGRIMGLIPDDGFMPFHEELSFVERHQQLEVFAYKAGESKAVMAVPSDKFTYSLQEIYKNKNPIAITGSLLDSISVKELSEKWSMSSRNIALMVNGNAINAPMIRDAVLDFIKADTKNTQNLNLAVCIFNRDPKIIFGKEWRKIQLALKRHKNILIVRSQNSIEASILSQYISRWAHLLIGKPPGENAFMSAAYGCLDVESFSVVSNEQNNALYNLDKILLSTYPASNYRQWKSFMKQEPDDIQSLAARSLKFGPMEDFIEYVHKINDNNFAKEIAIDGYIKSAHLNTLHMLTIVIAQIYEGELTSSQHEMIERFMEQAQHRFNKFMHDELEKYKKELGKQYSIEDLMTLMPQKVFNQDNVYYPTIKKKNHFKLLAAVGVGAIVALNTIKKRNKKNTN